MYSKVLFKGSAYFLNKFGTNMLYSRFDNVVILFTITLKVPSLQHLQVFKSAFSSFHLEVKRNTLKTAIAGTAAPVCALETKIKTFSVILTIGTETRRN